MTEYDMIWHDMIWLNMIWYDMTGYEVEWGSLKSEDDVGD